MRTDKTTLQDLSVFGPEGGVFHLLDHTLSAAGRATLRRMVESPPQSFEALVRVQEVVRWWQAHPQFWTGFISNGTVVMLERFFEAADSVAAPPSGFLGQLAPAIQKLFNRNEFTFVKFSVQQLADFYLGLQELVTKANEFPEVPARLRDVFTEISGSIDLPLIDRLRSVTGQTPHNELAQLAYRARRELKTLTHQLLLQFAQLDAWRSLALATRHQNWQFPELLPEDEVRFEGEGLYHPLLKHPVPYDLTLTQTEHFLLLTGANMSGKTTFLRSLGLAALLAHIGCGVPATRLRISFLRGIVTNMHVEDNLLKGESYFFAEVQRMKSTALRLQSHEPHLVLMDELFKGTNVHDAYECTKAVVEGLSGRRNQLMVLSTHLHEIAAHFEGNSALQFGRFVTEQSADGSFSFPYKLLPGVSSDRIGYRILQREGVLELLKGQ
jgi:DNA mismatch repair ATPase MutS